MVAFVDDNGLEDAVGQDADLLDSLCQGVAIIGIARHERTPTMMFSLSVAAMLTLTANS